MIKILYLSALTALLLSSIVAPTALAQSGFKLNLPLAKMPDTAPNRLFYIDSVYATFPDTACIGQIYRAGSGETAPAYVKGGLSTNLSAALGSLYPQLSTQHRPVRLRIDSFSYVEDPTQGYNFDAGLTFFRLDSTGYVPFYTAVLDADVSGIGRAGRIMDELLRATKAMNAYLNSPTTNPARLIDHEETMKKAASAMKLDSARYGEQTSEDSVLTCQKRRAGIYLNATDLVRNRPTLTGELAVDDRDGFAILLRPDKRRALYRFFGFSDGQNLYVNTSQYGGNRAKYARVQQIGRYLLWRDDYVTISEVSTRSAAASAGAAGGLIGGLVGGLVGAAATNRKDCIAIDARTGKLIHVTPDKLSTMLADQPALLTDYTAAGKPRKAELMYDYLVRYNQMVANR